MTIPRLICFVGYKGSGKSTAAMHLVQRHDGFKLVKFADGLKNMLRSLGLSEAEIEGDKKEAPSDLLCGRTPRHAMQTLGTEWGRDCISKDFWVKLWVHRVQEATQEGYAVVCDDLRFPNEEAAALAMKALIVRVVRPGHIEDSHSSEQHVRNIRAGNIILNNDSIESLNYAVEQVVLGLHSPVLHRGLKFSER